VVPIISSLLAATLGLYSSVITTPLYNDIGLYDTPPTTSHILWYQSIPQCYP